MVTKTPSREAIQREFTLGHDPGKSKLKDSFVVAWLQVIELSTWLTNSKSNGDYQARLGIASVGAGYTEIGGKYLRACIASPDAPTDAISQGITPSYCAGLLAWMEDDPAQAQRYLETSVTPRPEWYPPGLSNEQNQWRRSKLKDIFRQAIRYAEATGNAQLKLALQIRMRNEFPEKAKKGGSVVESLSSTTKHILRVLRALRGFISV